MARRPRVALLIEMSGSYGRRVLREIAVYLRSHRPWSIFLERRTLRAKLPRWLIHGDWDGIISRSLDKRLSDAFHKLNVPVVDLNDRCDLGFPRIRNDDRAIGRLGAEHLLVRNFSHFAFCALSSEAWATERCAGFVESVRNAGYSCEVYQPGWRGGNVPEWDRDQERIARWIQSLPKPLGVMAANDQRGQHVLDACRRVDLVIPEQVGVIGVDNEDVFCDLCDPPLSSVEPNPERVGREAAELLDRLMAGAKPTAMDWLVEPLGVVLRESTDASGIDDPEVAAARRHIRQYACDNLTVNDVVAHVAVSRSALERRFRKSLGHSPQAEIRLARLKHIKRLLWETDLSLESIARLTGYPHPEYMGVVFKRMTGQTPLTYRRQKHSGQATEST